MAREHAPTPAPGGADDGAGRTAFDWFRALDLAVWAAVIVIAALGVEWAFGTVLRERVTAQATRILAGTGVKSE
jgi:hypothetical protein